MSKTIAIIGATGAQGGGVANIFLETAAWKVRAITRNVESDKARTLASRGAEIVSANLDDEDSLVQAFEGVHAIFGVTNFWEHLFMGKTPEESGALEVEQAMNLARAASRTLSLEHYVWSTLPGAEKTTNGQAPVPHADSKDVVDGRIRKELPDLAKKTTFLIFGFYPSNMVFFPFLTPFEYPGSYGKYVQVVPTPATVKTGTSGDITVTPGIWTRQILANPDKTQGRYANVDTGELSFGDMLKHWSEISGKGAVYLEVSKSGFEELWGAAGKEFVELLKWGEIVQDWTAGYDIVSKEELGIKDEELQGLGFKAALEKLKAFIK